MTRKNAALLLFCVGITSSLLAHAEEPKKLAFVDTGNTGRSVMAEAIANKLISGNHAHVAIISRAVDLDPYDVKPEENGVILMRQRGIDTSAHRSVQLSANDIKHSDVILTMTSKHKAKVIALFPEAASKTFTLAEYAAGAAEDVPDAWGKPLPFYQDVVKQLDRFIPSALEKLVAQPKQG